MGKTSSSAASESVYIAPFPIWVWTMATGFFCLLDPRGRKLGLGKVNPGYQKDLLNRIQKRGDDPYSGRSF